jgi:flavorubredoxin
VFGSYGWSGEAIKMIEERLQGLRFKLPVPSLSVRFTPTEENLKACQDFARLAAASALNPDAA